MGAKDIFPLVDRLAEGELASSLKRWRSEGLSYDAISDRIRDEWAVKVTGQTVRNWIMALADAD